MVRLKNKSIPELLALHAAVMDELREHKILRSANSPVGDLAEFLFCKAFRWERAPKAAKGFDATDGQDKRYQIKGRRLDRHRRSKLGQLSGFRDFESFQFLAVVLFDHDYCVDRAALIPASIVRKLAKPVERSNSYRLRLQDNIWDEAGVTDATERLRAVRLP